MSAQTVDELTQKFNEISALPAGSEFQFTLTEEEASAAAGELLTKYKDMLQEKIQQFANVKIDVSNPEVSFGDNEITLSAKAGVSFLKVTASLSAEILWNDGALDVNVTAVDVPVVKLDPEQINSYLDKPLSIALGQLNNYYETTNFEIRDGAAVWEAVKK